MNGLHLISMSVRLLLAASVCLAVPMATAQRPQAAIAPLPEALRAQLALTSAQINNIVRLHEQYRQDTGELKARMARLQAAQAVGRKPGQRNQTHRNPELETITGQIEDLGARYRSAVRGLLDETQRESMDQLERAALLQRVIEQAQCFALLKKTPPDEPAACGEYQREP